MIDLNTNALPQCVKDDLAIPPGFIEAIRKKDGIDMDIFGEPAYNYYDGNNPFTDAYKAFYGEEEPQGENPNVIVISDFIRDMVNYYGANNLKHSAQDYQVIYQDMCTIGGMDANVELNSWMAEDAKETKAAREKTEKSKPLWNALKF